MVANASGTATIATVGSFKTATFRGNGSFVIEGLSSVSTRNRARVIIAAGGGAGHNGGGGGGGAGVLRNESYAFTSPTTWTVTVAGSAGGNSSGNNTSFGSIIAYGGGTGGSSGGSGGGHNGAAQAYGHGQMNYDQMFPGVNHGGADVNTIVSSPFIGSGIGTQYGMTGSGNRSWSDSNNSWGAGRNHGGGGGGAAGITTARKTPSNPTGGTNGHGVGPFWGGDPGHGSAGPGGSGHRYIDSTFGIDWHMGHGGGGAGGGDLNGETGGGSGGPAGGSGSGNCRNCCPYAPCNAGPFVPGCFAAAGPGVPGNLNPAWFGGGGGGARSSRGGHCEGDDCQPCGPSVQAQVGGGGSGGVVIVKWQFKA